jgi:uncharacterized protein with HEPN domain
MRLEALKFLYDIQQACALLSSFVAGKAFDDYTGDALLRSGVERQLTIVGEALNRLIKIEPVMASAISGTPQIIAFRNILVHGYDIVRSEVVWGVLENDLATLTREVGSLIERETTDQEGIDA